MTLLSFQTTVTGSSGTGDVASGSDRVAVVSLSGELDVAGAALLEHELARISTDHDPGGIVLDLSGLDFMDSTGLRLIVLADDRARQQGREFFVVRGAPDVHRVFEITRMVDRLTFISSAAEAGG